MAILKLKPSGKDYIWGGHKLVDNYGKEMTGDRLAETWELSCHPDGPSFVANGEDAGKTDRKSTRLNSSHSRASRMPSSA